MKSRWLKIVALTYCGGHQIAPSTGTPASPSARARKGIDIAPGVARVVVRRRALAGAAAGAAFRKMETPARGWRAPAGGEGEASGK
jgi:hypothetical protein